MISNKYLKILCVRTDFIGDGVLTSPFIKMLKTTMNANLDVLCCDYNFCAFEFNPYIDKIYCLPNNVSLNHSKASTIKKLLSNNSYTAIFLLNRDRKTYTLIKSIPTKYIFAYTLGRKSFKSLLFTLMSKLNTKYKYINYSDDIHEVINLYNLLKNSVRYLDTTMVAKLETKCYFYTKQFNPENQITKDITTVVMNISGKFETTRYIPTSLAICIITGILALNKKVLIVASEIDKQRAQDIVDFINDEQNISICCEQNLYTVADKISQYQNFIGADGGLLHIAAGLQMHCIGLFHTQNVFGWHPWSETQQCVQTPTKRIYDILPRDILKLL